MSYRAAAGGLPSLRRLERDAVQVGVRDREEFKALVENVRRKGA